ncbi:MAG TPA: DNA-binding protein, partial [Thermoplasmatales archaeon]|nr:DNA-binding protein [Thermoplasmatales archaeon]
MISGEKRGGESIWIGVDDTDSRKGGCTTYVAYRLILKLIRNGYCIIGYPRLVRLNPNIPWKTRGNGAIALQVRREGEKPIQIGENQGKKIYAYREGAEEVDVSEIKNIVEEEVVSHMREEENTNPGFVILEEQPPYEVYKKTIHEIVRLEEIEEKLSALHGYWNGFGNKRGLIGATAAVSWRP